MHLGERTCDVYLNDNAYWKNIPARVWDYTIGGYQVIKKWLSYRELELLGRPLTPEEAREVMNMARRIAAIVLLEPALDANYQAVKDAIGDNNTQRRTIFLLAAAGFDADYVPIDPAAPGAALADRAAVYLLSCPVYASARQQLGISPLDDAPADTCEVLRAARYRAAA